MDSTNTPKTQGGAQDVVPSAATASMNAGLERGIEITSPTGWRRMETAPVRDLRALIDIWSGSEHLRYTDCFWCPDSGEAAVTEGWYTELPDMEGQYNQIRVPDPVAWMPVPKKPEWA